MKAKNVEDLAALDRGAVADAARAASQQVSAWKAAAGEITSAESSLVNNILNSQQKLSQTLLQVAGQFVEREIANDLKYYTMRALLGNTDQATQTARAQAGLLVHLTTEAAMTNASVAGNAARAASDASSQTSFLEQIGKMLAGWLGFETDKAAATIAGNTASTASQVAFGMGEIPIDAAVGAAGAEAFFAPYGPEVSAPAATAEYAKILGWGFGLGGAGLAQGTNFVPSDMMTLIHAGERVVPAADNSALMAALNGGGGGGTVVNVNYTVNAVDTSGFQALLNKHGAIIAKTVSIQLQRNSGLRGNY